MVIFTEETTTELIGITEGGDASLHSDFWIPWVKEGKPAILITKNPTGLVDILDMKKLWNSRIIIHAVITGLAGTVLEPNVPNVERQIKSYKYLCHKINPSRVVLRIDPIIPTHKGVMRSLNVLDKAITTRKERVRISFMDNYDHVKRRFDKIKIPRLPYDFHAPLNVRQAALKSFQSRLNVPIEVCAEPGLTCSGCISEIDCNLLNITPSTSTGRQRRLCLCLAQKKELIPYKTRCEHQCLYCYWRD